VAGASVAETDASVGCGETGVLVAGVVQAANTPTSKRKTTIFTFMDFISEFLS